MVLDDDDDRKWVYHEHTSAKHEVYRKYLKPWIFKLTYLNEQRNWPNEIRIVDCFAGRGSYVETDGCDPIELHDIDTPADIPGSPQIILDKLVQHADQFDEAEAVFIEDNDTNFEILDETISNTEGIPNNIEPKTVHGQFQNEVLDVVNATDGSDFPTLFFIDPFGFKSLDYDVITEIGSTPQFEFLITFMYKNINRFYNVDYHEDAVQTVFGSSDFKNKVDQYDPQHWEDLVEYYTDRLEENGPQYTFEYLITESDTTQTIYYLVFGTNHSNGLKTMREVMHTCGTGGFGYAPKRTDFAREQTGLGSFGVGDGLEDTKRFLLNNFEDYRIGFNDLVEKCSEQRKYAEDVESDYRKAIKELENEGNLEVVRLQSDPEGNGVQRGDLIDFRTESPDHPDE